MHPDMANCYENIGDVYNNLDKFDLAFTNYEKCFNIR